MEAKAKAKQVSRSKVSRRVVTDNILGVKLSNEHLQQSKSEAKAEQLTFCCLVTVFSSPWWLNIALLFRDIRLTLIKQFF